MQIAFKLDPVTQEKIKKSALIALSGFVVSAAPTLVPAVLALLNNHPDVALAIGALATWLVNSAQEYVSGSSAVPPPPSV